MERSNARRRLAEAEADVHQASLHVRRKSEEVAELKRNGQSSEVARAEAMLELLEDRLRRLVSERNSLHRHYLPDRCV